LNDLRETAENPSPGTPAVSRSFIVASRVLLLLVAATAALVAVIIVARDRVAAGASETGARWACPMHPEVRAAQPGQCPICRMALEPVRTAAGSDRPGRGGMAGMADMTAVDNVRKHKILEYVRLRSLLPNTRDLRGPAVVDADGIVDGLFYTDQIAVMAAGEAGTFALAGFPDAPLAVRRVDGPAQDWDGSTSRVRFRLEKPGARLEPGRVGWIELTPRPRQVLGVPATAILQGPEGPYVLVRGAGAGFEKRSITVGETFAKQGFAVVLSGLSVNERVVGKAAFFLDADRRLGGPDMDQTGEVPP
jgi:hypothetical protein